MSLLLVHHFKPSCIGHLEDTGLPNYVDLPNVDTHHCTAYFKNHTVSITFDLIRNVLREAVRLMVPFICFLQFFFFCLKA